MWSITPPKENTFMYIYKYIYHACSHRHLSAGHILPGLHIPSEHHRHGAVGDADQPGQGRVSKTNMARGHFAKNKHICRVKLLLLVINIIIITYNIT